MRLSEIMSAVDLSVYPQAALFIFLGVFVAVAFRVFRRSSADEARAMALIPLDEGERLASSRPDAHDAADGR